MSPSRIELQKRNQGVAGLSWAVLLLNVCIVFSIVRTLEYLNVPVWDWGMRLAQAAAWLLTEG